MNIEKLPKWAKEHITQLERQRDSAVQKLNEMCNSQTPSPIYVDDWTFTGEGVGQATKRQYIQADNVTFDYVGIVLEVTCFDDNMKLQWHDQRHSMNEIALIPESYQQCRLVARANMR